MVLNSGPLAQGPKLISREAASQPALRTSDQVTGYGQLRIAAGDGGTPCSVVPHGAQRRYRVEGALTGNPACQWTCGAGLAIAGGQADQPVVEVTGLVLSGSAGDQYLTVVVNNAETRTIALTVASMAEIATTIKATPPVGTALDITQKYSKQNGQPLIPDRPDQTFTSTRSSENFPSAFDKTQVLVLLRGRFPDLPLTARAVPGAAQVTWEAARDPGDTLRQHKDPALPTLTPRAAGTATLATDATGSFAVRAYVACGCGSRHADLTTVLLVVMVEAELVQDRTRVSDDGLWDPGRSRFGPFATAGNGEAQFVDNAEIPFIELDADFRLISGGPDGLRYIRDLNEAIQGYWCNNIIRKIGEADLTGTYTQNHTYRVLYAAKANPSASQPTRYGPDDPLTDIGGPIWDGTLPCEPPPSLRLAGASTDESDNNVPPGLLITARADDKPHDFVPLYHPSDRTSALVHFAVDMRFMAAFYLCSLSAPAVIGIACVIGWRVEAEINYQPPGGSRDRWSAQAIQVPHVTKYPTLSLDPVQPADRAKIMVWGPGSVDHIAKQFS
jgi:hypothetical protein